MRIKEQETHLTLQEHDDDDDELAVYFIVSMMHGHTNIKVIFLQDDRSHSTAVYILELCISLKPP